MQGKIIKGIAGFYYVHSDETGIYECRAKGLLRQQNLKPLVGDNVTVAVLDEKEKTGSLEQILPRKNKLVRPAAANIDMALVVFSVASPQPNLNLLDRFLISMQLQDIPVTICFNKKELLEEEKRSQLAEIYESCGYPVLFTSAKRQEGIDELKSVLCGKTAAAAGPSGVGKSSLVNLLQPSALMQTGEISRKIERGRQTTRHTELIHIGGEAYIMDTPGFSSLFLPEIEKEELQQYYPEFAAYEDDCRFYGCSHISEPDCGVKQALDAGKIHVKRYENYCQLYEELKGRRKYKKNIHF